MDEVKAVFKGRLMSVPQVVPPTGVEHVCGVPWFRQFGNSGACAVSVAIGGGAKKVVLIGYDCGFALDGKRHWHDDHPKGMTNCASVKQWPSQFGRVADYARSKGVTILNASRETTLRCFPRATVSDAL